MTEDAGEMPETWDVGPKFMSSAFRREMSHAEVTEEIMEVAIWESMLVPRRSRRGKRRDAPEGDDIGPNSKRARRVVQEGDEFFSKLYAMSLPIMEELKKQHEAGKVDIITRYEQEKRVAEMDNLEKVRLAIGKEVVGALSINAEHIIINEKFTADLEVSRGEVNRLKLELGVVAADKVRLQLELAAANEASIAVIGERDNLTRSLDDTNNTIDGLRAESARYREACIAVGSALRAAEGRVLRVEEELTTLRSDFDYVVQESLGLKAAGVALKEEYAKERASFESKLVEMNTTYMSLMDEAKGLQEEEVRGYLHTFKSLKQVYETDFFEL